MTARRGRVVGGAERAARRRVHARTCIGCRRIRPKADLVRLVRTAEGTVALDPSGSAPGRGAYVCPEVACLERGRRRLAGALRSERIDFEAIECEFEAVKA